MKNILFGIFASILLFSCNSHKTYPKAENAFDAGREFINGCLTGDFDKASFYMLQDSTNQEMLDKIHRSYDQKGAAVKQQFREASLIIEQEETLNDSTHIIHYKNSYDQIAHKVKVVLKDGTWQVDFKYTFNGNL